ncbi:MAG: diguanylate cyclase [Pseudomonadota bacterium]
MKIELLVDNIELKALVREAIEDLGHSIENTSSVILAERNYYKDLLDKDKESTIILLINENESHHLQEALDLGVDDYINLPTNKEDIKARIRIALRTKKFLNDLDKANYDNLTQIYNRNYFDSQISHLISNSLADKSDLSLAIIDIDNFKNINDNFGHLEGDKVLQQVAQTISENIREDDLLARFGGEEFILALKTNLTTARLIADRISKNIKVKHPLTVSIGLSSLEDGDSVESLIKRADDKLYEVK